MHIEQFRDFCISKNGVTENLPFDELTLVFKVMGKMFALAGLNDWEKGDQKINLKCDTVWAIELREEYEGINAGYHMNKKLWNKVRLNSANISDELAIKLINYSYDLVEKGLPKKVQKELEDL